MDKILFNRVACLGTDVLGVFDIIARDVLDYNQQKVRTDYFLDINNNKLNRPKSNEINKFLLRSHPYVRQQEEMPWLKPNITPNCIFMDSFAELVDQLFVNKKDNSAFCCYYSDVNHSNQFKEQFEERGLLDVNNIHNKYIEFFEYIRSKYDVPIVFIHFSAKFDKRHIFKEREKIIFDSISQLEKKYDIINITADEYEHAQKAPTDDSPYHFSRKTIENIAGKLAKTNWVK